MDIWPREFLKLGAINRHSDVRGGLCPWDSTSTEPLRLLVGGAGSGRSRALRLAQWTSIPCQPEIRAQEILEQALGGGGTIRNVLIRDVESLQETERLRLLTTLRARYDVATKTPHPDDRLVLTASQPDHFIGPNQSSHLTSVVDNVYLVLPLRHDPKARPWSAQKPADEGAHWTGGHPLLLSEWSHRADYATARDIAWDIIGRPPAVVALWRRHLAGLIEDPTVHGVARGAALQDQRFPSSRLGVAELAIAGWLVPESFPSPGPDARIQSWRMPGILRRWAIEVLNERSFARDAGEAP